MADSRADVAILGAGIAGAALAYHLSRHHFGSVVLYDPQTPAAGASGRAAGIVTEQLWNPWDVAVARESREEYAALAGRWDPSAFTTTGFARWTRDPSAEKAIDGAVERLRAWGVAVRRVEPASLTREVPWARLDDVTAAMRSDTDAVVTPSALTEIYAESARTSGVRVDFGTPFHSLTPGDGHWTLAYGTEAVRVGQVVVAAGAWTKRLLAGLGVPLPLAPYKTQAALLRPAPGGPSPFPSVHDLDLDVYVRPEANGRILAGDGTELVEVDPDRVPGGGDERFLAHLAESFETRFPGWAEAELVRAWAGVCTSTPDRRPLVGPVGGRPGLHVVVGFNGFGVMRAGGVARRFADWLRVGGESGRERDALEPVLPERFAPGTPARVPRPGFTLEGGDDPRF